MLIEFKVANFRSFRDEQKFSLVAGRDKTHPDNLIPCDGFAVAKTAAVYGPNASGKSNLIKAMKAMERFVLASATQMSLGDPISFVSPFRLDSETRTSPSRFEITVLLDAVTYVYGFSATTQRVYDEWLHVRRAGGRLATWLDRRFDTEAERTTWDIKGPINPDAELLQSKTRDNGLLLSRGAELNIKVLAPLFLWFREGLRILDLSLPPIPIAQQTARRVDKDSELRSCVLRLMRDADLGITGMHLAEEPIFPSLTDDAPKELRDAFTSLKTSLREHLGDERLMKFSVSTEHPVISTGEAVGFSLENDESNGTQRMFAVAGPILEALENGHLLVADELDCSMHPLLTRKLIQLFQSAGANTKGAQLVFATHDSSIMDASLFRRDQIWLTEKRRDGSTDLFSLYDIASDSRPRKAEALEKNYLAGRYGAVPKFGPVLEDLEIR